MLRIRSLVVGVLCAVCVVSAVAQSSLAGKWQGETGNGRQVVLDATVKGQQLSGTFTVAQQTVDDPGRQGCRQDVHVQGGDRRANPHAFRRAGR